MKLHAHQYILIYNIYTIYSEFFFTRKMKTIINKTINIIKNNLNIFCGRKSYVITCVVLIYMTKERLVILNRNLNYILAGKFASDFRVSDVCVCAYAIAYDLHCSSFSSLTNSSTASAVWWITSSNGKSSRLRLRSHFGHGCNALRHSAWNTAKHSSH